MSRRRLDVRAGERVCGVARGVAQSWQASGGNTRDADLRHLNPYTLAYLYDDDSCPRFLPLSAFSWHTARATAALVQGMSFFKNIEAGLNSGLDALAQEYSKLDNQPAGGGSGSREEGDGSSSAEEASGSSVGQRVSALLNAIEPGSLSNLEQSASGALKAFTPKLPVTPSLKLPSTDGLFPGFPGDAATEDEDKVTAAAATETDASPPEAAEAARRIAEAEARAAAAEERAAAAEARAATAERMAEDVEMRAEAAVEEAEARAAIAEDAARHGLARAPAGEPAEAEAAEAVPGEMPAEIAAALNVSSPRARPRALHPSCTRPAPNLCPLHLRHPRRPLPAGGPRRGGRGGRAQARGGGGAARGARGGGGGGGGSSDAT